MTRLALVGAFPFPALQGSQLYAAEQARALHAAGAEVTLLCYGRGEGPAPADLDCVRAPRALSPRRLRAGPSWLKPAADAALLAALVRTGRRRRFDALLAHNAEALGVALAARPRLRVPVVYVAHTLWRHEAPSYAPRAAATLCARLGAALDGQCARRADAVLALSQDGADALAPFARGPLARIPPGSTPAPTPAPDAVTRACARYGLAEQGYAVYAGNLDRYQQLADLDAAAAAVAAPCVAVTHDRRTQRFVRLRVLRVASPDEAALLVGGAAVAVLPRRQAGGFPMKLLGYMQAGRAILAHAGVADGLVHGESAWLLPRGAGAPDLAAALQTLLEDAALRSRLGAGAHRALERQHAWPALAARTLALVAQARDAARRPPRDAAGPARTE